MSFISSKSLVGIVDCNNFYVSCERVFQPKLEHRPVIVLSNNDGCVISRSNEAKALGIKMAEPYFKIQDFIKKYNIEVRSSNYALYGDLSRRVMQALKSLAPRLEVYSIDEAFLDLSGFSAQDLIKLSSSIVHKIKQWTGIPVTLGIGPSKTLAKLANFTAKELKIAAFRISAEQQCWLAKIFIADIWGIGRGWQQKLKALNIHTALDLQQQNADSIREQFNITLANTVLELQGITCYALDLNNNPKKQIIASRSFGKPLNIKESIRQALSFHIARAAEKLRQQNSYVKELVIFLEPASFLQASTSYRYRQFIKLPQATDDTRILLNAARISLDKIFIPGLLYKKIGVKFVDVLSNLNLQCIHSAILT